MKRAFETSKGFLPLKQAFETKEPNKALQDLVRPLRAFAGVPGSPIRTLRVLQYKALKDRIRPLNAHIRTLRPL